MPLAEDPTEPRPLHASLLALLALCAPAAVFWADGRTWLVETDPAPRLWRAEGWYAVAPDGEAHRYRLTVEARRPGRGADDAVSPASRRAVLERVTVGERRWAPVTGPRGPWPGPDEGFELDEEAVLQFRGDAVALARFRTAVDAAGAPAVDVDGQTLRLPPATPEPAPRGAAAAVAWLGRQFPELVDPCVRRPRGVLDWELPGGRLGRWLVLGAEGPACAGEAHGLALDPAAQIAAAGGLPAALWSLGLADARVSPDGRHALLLLGDPLPSAGRAQRDLLRFDDPCAQRRVALWTRDDPGPAVGLGAARRLDGARWLDAGGAAAWGRLRDAYFVPAEAPECLVGASLADSGDATPRGHVCRIEAEGRAWAGPGDLAAGVALSLEDELLQIRVRVHDPGRTRHDGVHFWLGGSQFVVGPDGLAPARGRRLPRALRTVVATFSEEPQGYRVAVEAPTALAGDPPALTVRVDDADPEDPRGAVVSLWAAGHPIDAQHRRPTPLSEDPVEAVPGAAP